jgi:hypothetical protein
LGGGGQKRWKYYDIKLLSRGKEETKAKDTLGFSHFSRLEGNTFLLWELFINLSP